MVLSLFLKNIYGQYPIVCIGNFRDIGNSISWHWKHWKLQSITWEISETLETSIHDIGNIGMYVGKV